MTEEQTKAEAAAKAGADAEIAAATAKARTEAYAQAQADAAATRASDIARAHEAVDASRIKHNASGQAPKALAPAVVAPVAIEHVAKQAPASQDLAKTLKRSTISGWMGLPLTEEFLRNLGFVPAFLDDWDEFYDSSDFPLICDALIARLRTMANKFDRGTR